MTAVMDRDVRPKSNGARSRLCVLHLAQPLDGGVPAVIRSLVAHQAAGHFSPMIAAPPESELADWARGEDIPYVPWPAVRSPGRSVPAETFRIGRLVNRLNPALIHLHSAKAGLAGRLAVRGRIPTVFQPHGWSFLAVQGPIEKAAKTWERHATRWTDCLVCVSRHESSLAVAAGIRGRMEIVPNGIDLRRITAAGEAERTAARTRLRLPPTPIVVCIGRLHEAKGPDLLVDAWRIVRRSVPQARLYLVGDGPMREALEREIDDSIVITGMRDDVLDWLAAADLVVVPSRWEGAPLVPLEAMARGRSVVAFDVAELSHLLAAGAGTVVPSGAIEELAEAATTRLLDPGLRHREGQLARRRAEQYDAARAARLMETVYDDVMAHSRNGR
jgi:glycosyltransferase involved in cell wall biosynthesis